MAEEKKGCPLKLPDPVDLFEDVACGLEAGHAGKCDFSQSPLIVKRDTTVIISRKPQGPSGRTIVMDSLSITELPKSSEYERALASGERPNTVHAIFQGLKEKLEQHALSAIDETPLGPVPPIPDLGICDCDETYSFDHIAGTATCRVCKRTFKLDEGQGIVSVALQSFAEQSRCTETRVSTQGASGYTYRCNRHRGHAGECDFFIHIPASEYRPGRYAPNEKRGTGELLPDEERRALELITRAKAGQGRVDVYLVVEYLTRPRLRARTDVLIGALEALYQAAIDGINTANVDAVGYNQKHERLRVFHGHLMEFIMEGQKR
jgi:hypothetical protein